MCCIRGENRLERGVHAASTADEALCFEVMAQWRFGMLRTRKSACRGRIQRPICGTSLS